MARDVPVGNGSLLVAYDRQGIIRDLYYPSAGMENHAQGHPFRVGAWLNGRLSWLDDPQWERTIAYEEDTLVARLSFTNRDLGVELKFRDAVDFHENLFVREMTAKNLSDERIELRLFFHHDFRIYGSDIGDTACYKPDVSGILHYKGRRYFLLNASLGEVPGIAWFATGVKEAKGLQGSWVDAEDGILSGNTIAQGSVDSVFSIHMDLSPGGDATGYYWIAVGEAWRAVSRLNNVVVTRTPAYFIQRTAAYWKLWSEKEDIDFDGLPNSIVRLYRRSLLILRTNVNENGAIIAGADSDIQRYYKDTYSYTWPRDGAIVAHALDLAGYPIPSRRFYDFCGQIIGRNGYFLHKYNPDGSLASSWHPWVMDGRHILPIQEDETALVLWALWEHFKLFRDIEFVKPLYRKIVKSAADFMSHFTDPDTGLPLPSYDLWEERLGVHTFTACSIIAGLRAAAEFTKAFGETELSNKYLDAAEKMSRAVSEHLYDPKEKRFARTLYIDSNGGRRMDLTLDSSLTGLVLFKVFPADDERVLATVDALRSRLWCKTEIGGMARYDNDLYQSQGLGEGVPGNPWIACTLWYAQCLIEKAANNEKLKEAVALLEWVAQRALPSGVLPEQINPWTGEPLSISPLTWSHAEFVITVQKYLGKLEKIDKCPQCGHPLFLKHGPQIGKVSL